MGEDAIDEVFETYEKYTTMMYRPPEMIDKYRRFNVSTKVDIWVSTRAYLSLVVILICLFGLNRCWVAWLTHFAMLSTRSWRVRNLRSATRTITSPRI